MRPSKTVLISLTKWSFLSVWTLVHLRALFHHVFLYLILTSCLTQKYSKLRGLPWTLILKSLPPISPHNLQLRMWLPKGRWSRYGINRVGSPNKQKEAKGEMPFWNLIFLKNQSSHEKNQNFVRLLRLILQCSIAVLLSYIWCIICA